MHKCVNTWISFPNKENQNLGFAQEKEDNLKKKNRIQEKGSFEKIEIPRKHELGYETGFKNKHIHCPFCYNFQDQFNF